MECLQSLLWKKSILVAMSVPSQWSTVWNRSLLDSKDGTGFYKTKNCFNKLRIPDLPQKKRKWKGRKFLQALL